MEEEEQSHQYTQANPPPLVVPGADYYVLLNVPRDVKDEELRASYRRLSVMFHPDKHVDPADKQTAEKFFKAINEAFEVLSDPNKRSIYDMYGLEGLRAGWQLGPRLRTPQELRESYERMKREREDELLRQQANSKGQTRIEIDASWVFDHEGAKLKDSKRGFSTTTEGSSDLELIMAEYIPKLIGVFAEQDIEWTIAPGHVVTVGAALVNSTSGFGGTSLFSSYKGFHSGFSYEIDASSGKMMPLLGLKLKRKLPLETTGVISMNIIKTKNDDYQPSFDLKLSRQLSKTAVGSLTLSPAAVTVDVRYVTEQMIVKPSLRVGVDDYVFGLSSQYRVNKLTNLIFSVNYHLPNALGSLSFGISQAVSELLNTTLSLEISSKGVTMNIKLLFTRLQHMVEIPIFLAHELRLSVLGAVMIPLVGGYAIQKFILDPRQKLLQKRHVEHLRRENAEAIAAARREAEEAVRLMKDHVQRKMEAETNRNGLIIVEAKYGRLGPDREDEDTTVVIDVTTALQSLVFNSQLHLHSQSKVSLIGFYDPCIGEAKSLRVVYLFKRRLHEVTINDEDPLALPLRSHAISRGDDS